MSRLTNVSKAALGDIRFGDKPHGIDTTVKEWQMSPQQLEEYNRTRVDLNKPDKPIQLYQAPMGEKIKKGEETVKEQGLTKEKFIELKKQFISDKEVMEKYNMSPKELAKWKRGNFTDEEVISLRLPKRRKAQNVATGEDKTAEYESVLAELKKKISDSDHRFTSLKKAHNELAERAHHREEKLESEIQNLKVKINYYEKTISSLTELEKNFYRLKKENETLKELVKIWA